MSRAVGTPDERLLVSTTGMVFRCRCLINWATSAKRPDTRRKATSRLPPQLVSERKLEFDIGNVIQWEGKPVADIKTSFNHAVDRVYLKNVSPHTLKHTAATWLMQSGKDPFKISDFLSTSVLTLLKHYGHHNPDHQNEIAEAISARPDNVRIMR